MSGRDGTLRRRTLVGGASVACVVIAVLTALWIGPREYRVWLAVAGLVGIAMAFSSLLVDPRELLPMLVFSAAPVISLTADGSPTVMIAPLGVLLLLAGELNAYSWELDGPRDPGESDRRRLARMGQLCAAALVGSLLAAAAARWAWFDSTVAVAGAALALVALAQIALPSGGAVRGGVKPRS